MLRSIAFVLAALMLESSPLAARTWSIRSDGSGDAPTIQAGIDSAMAGDEVVLAAGTYSWTSQGATGVSMIRMKRDVLLRGQSGASLTVLDAERQGRVLECVDVSQAHIEGLTITRGHLGAVAPRGAGIFVTGDSQPIIDGCIIRDNGFSYSGQASGGGIWTVGGRIVNCEIIGNTAHGENGSGGGIQCSNTEIATCVIRGNIISGGDGSAHGAGIQAGNSTVTDCLIESNVNQGSYFGGSGGGAGVFGGSVLRCTFVGNSSPQGGGLYASGCSVTECLFVRNVARGCGGILPPRLRTGGGAIGSSSGDQPCNITSCTLIGNVGPNPAYCTSVGGIALESGGSVSSCIIAYNQGLACSGAATFSCDDLYGNTMGNSICGTDGGGNFSADPQFCAADPVTSLNVSLQADSPCAPGNHPDGNPCGLIGAGQVECGSVALQERTWSKVKSIYRK